jgi:hypothetical protein
MSENLKQQVAELRHQQECERVFTRTDSCGDCWTRNRNNKIEADARVDGRRVGGRSCRYGTWD